MQQLDNDPNGNWIIPAIIQVRVDPPNLQVNQQINNNGVYEIYDEDPNQNNGLEIVPDNPQQQQNQRVLKLREVKTRDGEEEDDMEEEENEEEEEPSETKTNYLGKFTVNVPQPTITQISNYEISNIGSFNIPIPIGYDAVDSISGTVDLSNKLLNSYTFEPSSLPSTFNIEDYNQANNTDYIGVKEIVCSDTNLQPQQSKIVVNTINIDNVNTVPDWVQSVNVNGHYDITDRTYTYMFLSIHDNCYRISLIYKTVSSTVSITNNTSKKIKVYRIMNQYSPKGVILRHDDVIVSNFNIHVPAKDASANVTSLTANCLLNESYYDLSSFIS